MPTFSDLILEKFHTCHIAARSDCIECCKFVSCRTVVVKPPACHNLSSHKCWGIVPRASLHSCCLCWPHVCWPPRIVCQQQQKKQLINYLIECMMACPRNKARDKKKAQYHSRVLIDLTRSVYFASCNYILMRLTELWRHCRVTQIAVLTHSSHISRLFLLFYTEIHFYVPRDG